MGLRNIDLDVKFDKKTRKVKRLKIEKLGKPVADFVKHLNFVLSETPYAVGFVNEQKYTLNGKIKRLITGIEDEDKLRIDFTFYNRGQEPIPNFEEGIGYVVIELDEETDLEDCELEFFEFSNPRGIKYYFDKMKDYDFSKIFEYYLNAQKFK
jgi:hypothetical protein